MFSMYIRLETAIREKSKTLPSTGLTGRASDHPHCRERPNDLGQDFFRWEFAGSGGAILDLNPSDQPDVEANKVATKQLTAQYERTGALHSRKICIFEEGGICYLPVDLCPNASGSRSDPSLEQYLAVHLNRLTAGDYGALLAYLEMDPTHEADLQTMRVSAGTSSMSPPPAWGLARDSSIPRDRGLPKGQATGLSDHQRGCNLTCRYRASITVQGSSKRRRPAEIFRCWWNRGRRLLQG